MRLPIAFIVYLGISLEFGKKTLTVRMQETGTANEATYKNIHLYKNVNHSFQFIYSIVLRSLRQ
jgi:hypothetical protein